MRKILSISSILIPTLAIALGVDTAAVKGADRSVSFVAWPSGPVGVKRPALVLAPEWWGLNGYAQRRAKELASEGYVVLAADFYGNRQIAKDPAEAGKLAGAFYGDPAKFKAVVARSVAQLKARPDVDTSRIGALGFCFGGAAVLEGARTGLPLKAVGSFHGGVKPFSPTPKGAVKGRVLVLHGGADPNVSMDDVASFVRDMEASGADYSVTVYPQAVHAFTNPEAGTDPAKGAAYDARAEKESFEAFHKLLTETGMKP